MNQSDTQPTGRDQFDIDAEDDVVREIAKQFREQFPDRTAFEVQSALHILDLLAAAAIDARREKFPLVQRADFGDWREHRAASHRHNWATGHQTRLTEGYDLVKKIREALA